MTPKSVLIITWSIKGDIHTIGFYGSDFLMYLTFLDTLSKKVGFLLDTTTLLDFSA